MTWKITEMIEAVILTWLELIEIVQSWINKKLSLTTIKTWLESFFVTLGSAQNITATKTMTLWNSRRSVDWAAQFDYSSDFLQGRIGSTTNHEFAIKQNDVNKILFKTDWKVLLPPNSWGWNEAWLWLLDENHKIFTKRGAGFYIQPYGTTEPFHIQQNTWDMFVKWINRTNWRLTYTPNAIGWWGWSPSWYNGNVGYYKVIGKMCHCEWVVDITDKWSLAWRIQFWIPLVATRNNELARFGIMWPVGTRPSTSNWYPTVGTTVWEFLSWIGSATSWASVPAWRFFLMRSMTYEIA